MQGSGTFGVESVIQTSTKPEQTNFLVLENGAYGQRIEKICKLLGIRHHVLRFAEDRSIDLDILNTYLQTENSFTHVVSLLTDIWDFDKLITLKNKQAVIHGETTSGALNKVEEIGKLVKKYNPGF